MPKEEEKGVVFLQEGLEQGWIIDAPPAESDGGGGLRLEFALRGGLLPVVSADGQAISFADNDGITALTYGGLILSARKIW